jgi:hypothetical protein
MSVAVRILLPSELPSAVNLYRKFLDCKIKFFHVCIGCFPFFLKILTRRGKIFMKGQGEIGVKLRIIVLVAFNKKMWK